MDRARRMQAEGLAELALPEQWTPEHLVLAALARCSLASLAFHVRRAELDFVASATASGAVARREDGGWGFVDLECALDVELEPALPQEELSALVARAERGCFVGASLSPRPQYRWQLNGQRLE
ncbi:MAG: OsmC family protein [Actinobacteria bacterium]|nr:OsmC family protein [Actinomycetota bacterium]